jgi:Na+/proline symporter
MAIRDDTALRRARLLTMVWFVVVFAGMFVTGLAGRALFPSLPPTEAESIFFRLTNSLFSPLVAGMLVAAVLSAIMSTADSQLLVGASSIAYDLGLSRRFPRTMLLVPRLTIALLVVASILIALYIPATIFARVLFAWSALGAAFGPTVVLRVAGVRLPAPAVFTATIVGFVSAAMFFAFSTSPGQVFERVVPFGLGLAILWMWRRR